MGNEIRNMFIKCYRDNTGDPESYQASIEMSQLFENRFRAIDNLSFNVKKTDPIYSLRKKVEKLNSKIEHLKKRPAPMAAGPPAK